MLRTLSAKIFIWLLFNILLLIFIGFSIILYLLFGNGDGLVPASFFGKDIENIFKLISVELQYKPTRLWPEIVEKYEINGLKLHLLSMDEKWMYYWGDFVPYEILEIAGRIPRTPYTLCEDPSTMFADREYQTSSGLAPVPPAIYARKGAPPLYWYGRTLFVPDELDHPHYLLLAARSETFDGNGQFFSYRHYLSIGALILALSFLWWLPFILHITRPLLRMTSFAENIATNGQNGKSKKLDMQSTRKDEIGRLGRALDTMTKRLEQQMAGQSQFIRHIAHELNTSLGHCNLGLAVLEQKSEGEFQVRVRKVMAELENLSHLTTDVLDFLRANSTPQPPACQILDLQPIVMDVVRNIRRDDCDIRISVSDKLQIWGDKRCVMQALTNAIRNAITYAGKVGPIYVDASVRKKDGAVLLKVTDSGPGVKETDLGSIMEPFFRGADAQLNHPCGSGLGLSIIKSSLEQCGGSVICANEKPKGFSLTMIFSH